MQGAGEKKMAFGTLPVDWNTLPSTAISSVCGSLRKLADLKSVLFVSKTWLSTFGPLVRRRTPWRRLGCKDLPVREYANVHPGRLTLVAESATDSTRGRSLVCMIHDHTAGTCFESGEWKIQWKIPEFQGMYTYKEVKWANFDGESLYTTHGTRYEIVGDDAKSVHIYEASSGNPLSTWKDFWIPLAADKVLFRNGMSYFATPSNAMRKRLDDPEMVWEGMDLPICGDPFACIFERVETRLGKHLLVLRGRGHRGRRLCILRLNRESLATEAHDVFQCQPMQTLFMDVHEDRVYKVLDNTFPACLSGNPRYANVPEDCKWAMMVSPLFPSDLLDYSQTKIVPLSCPHFQQEFRRFEDMDFRVLFDRIYFVGRFQPPRTHPCYFLYVLDADTGESLYRVTRRIDSLVLSEVLPRTFYTSDSEGRTHVWYEGAEIADVPHNNRYPYRKIPREREKRTYEGAPGRYPERTDDAKKRKTT